MDLRQTDMAVRDVKGDSGFEGFRGSQKKGLRDSGVKSEAVVKFRLKFQALAVCAALMTFATTGWGQTSTQTFGSSAGSHASQTGSTSFIPNPAGSGTTWARAGNTAAAATINLVTSPNPLGTTGAFLRGVASSSAVISKASPVASYTTATTEFYTSFKVLFGNSSGASGPTDGNWTFYQGAGAMYTDASDFSGTQVFSGLRFSYGASGAITLNYRSGSAWVATSLTSSSFTQGTVYTVEIVANNKSSGAISYSYNGNSRTVAVQTFDLYINGTLVGDDLARAQLAAGSNINATTFIGQGSTSNAANIFVDDFVVYNAVPATIGASAPTVTSSAATSISTTGATLNGNVTADGGASLTERGFYTKTSSGVTTSDTKRAATGTTTGAYTLAVTGLSVNTRYYFKSFASNSAGPSLSSTEQDFWTLANAPSAPTLSLATTSGFSVAVNENSNPASTEFAIRVGAQYVQANGTLGASEVWQTKATWGTPAVTGLSPVTQYTVDVKARNGASTQTSFGTSANITTTGVPEIAVQSPTGTDIASGGNRGALGTVTVGSNADFTFRVVNSGSAALSVTGITFGGADSEDFSVQGSPAFPVSVAAGTNQDFTIRFAPTADGARAATVTFANSDSDEDNYVINLSGTGSVAAVAPTVTSASASSITSTGATLNGTINSDGGAAVTDRGFVYSSSATTPTIDAEGVTKVTVVGTTGVMNQAVAGLAAATTIYFRAYAINSLGTTYGDAQSFTTLKGQPPLHVTGFAAGTITTANIPATWTGATADGYLLRVSSTTVSDPNDGTAVGDDTDLSDGAGTINLASNVTSYSSFTGFAAGTTYTFKLYPYHNSGANIDYLVADAPSFSAKLLPVAPGSAPTFASVTATGFTVNWSAVAGADSYRLDVSTASNFATFVGGYENLEVTGGTSQVVTGLSANTQYYARVRAVNATGTGTNSSAGNQTTLQLSAPTTLAASAVTSTGFTANWDAVTGATGYRVDVTTTSPLVATGLIISEYVEGSSNNKYIEIYNGTGSTVNLSDYEVRLFSNGANIVSQTQDLSALISGPSTLASGGTLVLKNSSAALALPAGVTAYNSAVATYNGDDALGIWSKSISAYVDIFGVIGDDPGTAWTSSTFTTVDKTLRRKTSVSRGVTTNPTGTGVGAFTALATEWDQYNIDTASGLGSHSLDSTTTFLGGYQNADAGSSTSLSVTGAAASKQYSYVVRATSAKSTSSNSDVRTVTTKGTSSIAVNSGTTSLTYSGSAQGPTFTVTGSTGAVTYSYAGTGATSYGPTATAPTNVGSYSATATAAADTNFDGVVSSATAFTIAKATPIISAAPAASAITYGQTLDSSVLSNGRASVDGSFTYTPTSTALSAGTANQAVTFTPADAANYNTASTTASVTVNPKPITVTADAKSKTYGAADPTLTYTSDALVNGDSLTGSLARAPGANVGIYAITQGSLNNANYDISFTGANFTIIAASLASSAITLTPAGDGSYTASAAGVSGFTYSYVGRDPTTYGPSVTPPTAAGFYTVTGTSTDVNYNSASASVSYSVVGPVAVADSRTKSAGNAAQLIPISELLANDIRITSTSGATVTGDLSVPAVTAVTSGLNNTATLAGAFIQFTPSSASTDTFTYTVSYGGKTATATVTVTTETQAPSFDLQIVKVGTADFAGGNTTVTHDFIGVPGQTYLVEYSTDLTNWASAGNQSTGATGSFSVTFTKSGDVAADWNAHMFFRARRQ